jgi:hypothetical protein
MLQNNIIPRMENLHHLKELEYLNLALNNVDMIQGKHACVSGAVVARTDFTNHDILPAYNVVVTCRLDCLHLARP